MQRCESDTGKSPGSRRRVRRWIWAAAILAALCLLVPLALVVLTIARPRVTYVAINLTSTPFATRDELDRYVADFMFHATGYEWMRHTGQGWNVTDKIGPPYVSARTGRPYVVETISGDSGKREASLSLQLYSDHSVQVTFGREDWRPGNAEGLWIRAYTLINAPKGVRFTDIRSQRVLAAPSTLRPRPHWPACRAEPPLKPCDWE